MPLPVLNSTTLAQRALMAMVVACCPPRLEAPLVNQAQAITPDEDAARPTWRHVSDVVLAGEGPRPRPAKDLTQHILELGFGSIMLKRNHLTVLAGYPSIGKTGLALSMLSHACASNALAAAHIRLDLSAPDLCARIMAIETRLPLRRAVTPTAEARRREAAETAARLAQRRMWVLHAPAPDVGVIAVSVRALKAEQPDLSIVITDDIQLMEGPNRADPPPPKVAETVVLGVAG